MDDLHWMMIALEAANITNERLGPDHPPCILGDEMNDDDRRQAIREYFAEVEELTDDVVETALDELKRWENSQRIAMQFADALIGSFMPARAA
jgi:predicted signal transduction protein with EAL and GGDEF domain